MTPSCSARSVIDLACPLSILRRQRCARDKRLDQRLVAAWLRCRRGCPLGCHDQLPATPTLQPYRDAEPGTMGRVDAAQGIFNRARRQRAPWRPPMRSARYRSSARFKYGGAARLVVIDSLSGYLAAMPGKPFLMLQLHELLAYLGQKAVTTLLVHGQKGGFLRSRQRYRPGCKLPHGQRAFVPLLRAQ